MSHLSEKSQKKPISVKIVAIAVPVLILLVAAIFVLGNRPSGATTKPGGGAAKSVFTESGDLQIPISEVSEKANFYPVEIDGTKLEVIAVKAPDGSVRTAFNTCQVCYDSGRGYYKQDGNTLVCQNCGNRFTMDQVEVASGGCNPVPIFPDNKTADDTNITISQEFLTKAKVIFENWKANPYNRAD